MNHPTEEQLNAWLDGEADALLRADDTAAHVEQCARCQQRVEGARSLGSALKLWAEDVAPAPADDLFERIMAEARAGGAVPAATEADGAGAGAGTEKPREAQRAPGGSGSGTAAGGNVTAIGKHRRWSPAWAAAPVILAAAAAAVFAITRPPTGVTTPTGPGTSFAVGEGPGAGQGTGAGTGAGTGGTRVASLTDPGGSSVLAVDVGGAHTSYSVLEVAGSREGSTTAVVWIEDSASP